MQFIAGIFLGAVIGLIAGVWLARAAYEDHLADQEAEKKLHNPIVGRDYEP